MVRIGKSLQERQQIEQMAEAVRRYTGPVQHCEPGIARGHEKPAALTTLSPNRANRQSALQSAATERHEQTTSQLAR
jgi:hypothetical protein